MVDKKEHKGVKEMKKVLKPRPRKKTKADFDLWRGLIVRVIWIDTLFCEETTEKQIAREPDVVFVSYGEIIAKTNKNLTLACTTGNEKRDRTLRECIRIPMSLIQTITALEEHKEVLYANT